MNDKFIIKGLAGKKTLNGKIKVNGSKNAILPLMASCVLFKDGLKMKNIPNLEDVKRMSELLNFLGFQTHFKNDSFDIDMSKDIKSILPEDISKRMRASIIMIGPMLGRLKQVSFLHPGGCVIGARPIDIFIKGFQKMGATLSEKNGFYTLSAKNGLRGAEIFFNLQSVTATESFIMAAVLAKGKTVLKNCAMEPEIVDLVTFLKSCGAKIKGEGTPTIEIIGGKMLSSGKKVYKAIPDRIETGSFLLLGLLACDNLEITNCNPVDIESLTTPLLDAGFKFQIHKDKIVIKDNSKIQNSKLNTFNIKTHEHPGFPTDLQAPATVLLTQLKGEAHVHETIFEGRLNYTEDLVKMGANINMWDANRVTVKGPNSLRGKELWGPDIRAGLAFILAAIVAKGQSIINNVYYIDRGYERIEERLSSIGVDIKRVSD